MKQIECLASCPDNKDKNEMKESLDEIEKNIEYINKIVSDLQDYARNASPEMADLNAEKMIQNALSSVTIPENVVVSFSVEKDLPKLTLDDSYLRRILVNLISNAVQAMPEGGKLTVNAFRQDSEAIISVEDTGEGISEEIKTKIFTPLFTTKSKGQGFGLPVVKKLTEAMGGNVEFENGQGRGAKFLLKFPVPK